MLFPRECTHRSGKSCSSWPVRKTNCRREGTLDIDGLREIVDALEQRVGDLMDKFDATMKQISHQQQMCLEFRQTHRQHEELYQILSERTFQRMDRFQGALENLRQEYFSLTKVCNGGKELGGCPEKKFVGGVHPPPEHHLENDPLAECLSVLQQIRNGPQGREDPALDVDRQRQCLTIPPASFQQLSYGMHQLSQRRECDPTFVESTLPPSRNQSSYATDPAQVGLTFNDGQGASMGRLSTHLVAKQMIQDIEDGPSAGCQPVLLGLAAEERKSSPLKMKAHDVWV